MSRIPHEAEEMEVGAVTLPEQSNEQAKATAKYIADQVKERDGVELRVALAIRLGSVVGTFLEHLVFWSGKSGHCENGWFYRTREEIH